MVKTIKDNLTDVSDSVMSEKCYFDHYFGGFDVPMKVHVLGEEKDLLF